MKKYLAVTICALSAAAVVTACSAGDKNDSDYKQGEFEESAVSSVREAASSRAETSSKAASSSKRADSSSKKDSSSSKREDSRKDDSDGLMSRIGEGADDILDGGKDIIDDTIDTGKDVVDDVFE